MYVQEPVEVRPEEASDLLEPQLQRVMSMFFYAGGNGRKNEPSLSSVVGTQLATHALF